jgi:hypothetical protein
MTQPAEPDLIAVMNLRHNEQSKTCLSCNGAGQVLKYIRPRIVAMVECVPCRGTGKHLQFTCPQCGSHCYGSSGLNCMQGNCHGPNGCRFTWPRTEDAKYFSGG